MIAVDGSYGEGGGQILRTAVALSAVTGKPCKITNIRSGRCNPGLQAQHLKGIEACAEICDGKFKGLKIGSTEVEFHPDKVKGGEYNIDIGTAGSIPLILQTLVVPCIHADKELILNIKGGTDVKWSPTFAFFEAVVAGEHSNLSKMGIEIKTELLKTGFYPKGGGKVRVTIKPCRKIETINWTDQGKITRVDCWSFSSKDLEKASVAERQMKGFEEMFPKIDCRDVQYVDALCPGSSITAHIHCNTVMGACALGERDKKAEDVGKECAKLLKKQIDSGTALDEHMADQILPFMALAGSGRVSVAEITNHVKTNIWAIEKFLPVKFEINGKIISCRTI
jgi:RNA 3'-phosphate cyclase